MAGTWLAIVEGFGGMRIHNGMIHFNPLIPEQWKSYSFHVRFRDKLMNIRVSPKIVEITNQSDINLEVSVYKKEYTVEKGKKICIDK